jgi:hypothetical protein
MHQSHDIKKVQYITSTPRQRLVAGISTELIRSSMRQGLALVMVLALAGCSAGPYGDLEARFASTSSSSDPPIAAKTLVLMSKRHRGAFSYREIMNIRLSADAIDIEPTGLFALKMKRLHIPRAAVTLCSTTCFGHSRWDANLLLGESAVDISVPNSTDMIDWCWQQRVPIASGQARRDWMYSNMALPAASTLTHQFSSREVFDHAAKQACLGY